MKEYDLSEVLKCLKGPSQEQLIVGNQWAAVALDNFHGNSKAEFNFRHDDSYELINMSWDSEFSKAAMKEKTDMAHFGGVALAFFMMSVICGYGYVEQTEIGNGVDYRFRLTEPSANNLNFLDDFHYVEISGILEENGTNTLRNRIKDKHAQINRGDKSNSSSSVIVTLFSQPTTHREAHR